MCVVGMRVCGGGTPTKPSRSGMVGGELQSQGRGEDEDYVVPEGLGREGVGPIKKGTMTVRLEPGGRRIGGGLYERVVVV